MSTSSRTVPMLLTLLLTAAGAGAAGLELTPTVGYRWGGELQAEDNALFEDDVELDSGSSIGLTVAFPVTRGLRVELLADHQEADLGRAILFGDTERLGAMDVTYYHVGVLYQWSPSRVHPFVAGSLGVADLDPDLPGAGNEERFSASVGGGLKLDLAPNLAFRLEARGFWTDTGDDEWDWDDDCDDWDCDDWDGSSDLGQASIRVGLEVRF